MQLSYVLFLLCPISMGVMMWVMMRGHGTAPTPLSDPRIAELESQVNELRSAVRNRTSESAETLN